MEHNPIVSDQSLLKLYTVLCPQCQDIFNHEDISLFDPEKKSNLMREEGSYRQVSDYERSVMRTHHEEISTMAHWADYGCYICNMVWRHFFPEKTPQQYREAPYFFRTDRAGHVMSHIFAGSGTHYILGKMDKDLSIGHSERVVELRIGLNSPISQDHHIPEYKTIVLSPLEDELSHNIGEGLEYTMENPPSNHFDDSCIETIQAWHRQCGTSHARCKIDLHPTWYPTRLLDLRAPIDLGQDLVSLFSLLLLEEVSGTGLNGVRLIETAETRPRGPYMTLSHRWPEFPLVTTTRANLNAMKRSINEDTLPTVFQQAIVITRMLGIRYLWIDSLCIIQEDEDDWTKEAKTMGQVYMQSYLTLSATAGGGSLVHERRERQITPCIRSPRWKGEWPRYYIVTDFRFWDERIYRAVTNTRCWITQERFLSPRVLHFTFDQLVWECCELEACETFFAGLPNETKQNRHTGFKQKPEIDETIFSSLDKSPEKVDRDEIAEHCRLWCEWTKVLETYCRTETTHSRDRLLGINIIASQFGTGFADEHVAGLWRKKIPGDMLWHVSKSRRSNWLSNEFFGEAKAQDINSALLNPPSRAIADSVRPEQYVAPSWSWISVLGDIEPGEFLIPGRDEEMIVVLDAHLEYRDPDEPIKGLLRGALKLRGRLYPIQLRQRGVRLPPEMSLAGCTRVEEKIEGYSDLTIETESHVLSLDPDQPEEYSDVEGSCFLPVMLRRLPSTLARKGFTSFGLEKYIQYIDAREEVDFVYGVCIKPTGTRGEYRRLGRVEFSLEECELLRRGFEAWKKDGFTTLMDEHPTSLNADLYHDGELGVLTIV